MEHLVTSRMSSALFIYLAFAVLDGSDALLCDKRAFDYGVYNICVPIYNKDMAGTNYSEECPWPNTRSFYNNLSYCVEYMVTVTKCIEPSMKNEIFLDLHRTYFSHCGFLKDPGSPTLLLFTLPSIILTFVIPFFCHYLTTIERSVQE